MSSASTPQWITSLCSDVQNGLFTDGLDEEHFNDVLKWLLEREFTVGLLITQSMLGFFDSEEKARHCTFLALDDHLFVLSNDSSFAKLGLPDDTEMPAVKLRYRRLIQLYHPDKGRDEAAGLTSRAEKINLAYDRIKSGQGSSQPVAPIYQPQAPSRPAVVRTSAGNWVLPRRPSMYGSRNTPTWAWRNCTSCASRENRRQAHIHR